MLDQRRRRWAAVVNMLYKCFVFAGMVIIDGNRVDLNHIETELLQFKLCVHVLL